MKHPKLKNEIDHTFIESEEIHDIRFDALHTFKGKQVHWRQSVSADGYIMRYDVIVDCAIEITCKAHGYLFNTVKLKSERRGIDLQSPLRLAIEDILMHRYHPDFIFHMPRCNCFPKYFKTVYDFSEIHDKALRKLFEDLFTDANWTIRKLISDAK